MTPEETKIVDRVVQLCKLTKLCQQDRDRAGSQWGQEWRDKSAVFEVAAERLSSGLSPYVAHGIHDKDQSGRELVDYCKQASGRINSSLKDGIPEGKEYAETREAVLNATNAFGVVTSVRSLNECLSKIEGEKTEVQNTLNAALTDAAEARGHAGAVTSFTAETAQKIARHFAHLQEYVHNCTTSASSLFRDADVGKVEAVSWDPRERAERIAAVEERLTELDNVRAATPQAVERPAKRQRQEIEPLSWQDQRHRLRSDEAAAVERTPALRPLKRLRMRGPEHIKEIREFDPRPRTRSR